MSQKEIEEIVADFRTTTCDISNDEVAEVLKLCYRKMEISGKAEDYLRLLLPDELKNHCFRRAVNATSLLMLLERECDGCAVCV